MPTASLEARYNVNPETLRKTVFEELLRHRFVITLQRIIQMLFPSQSGQDTTFCSKTVRRTESFHQQSHVKMLFMRALDVDWSSVLLQGYWVLK